jgi:hypothetical protein
MASLAVLVDVSVIFPEVDKEMPPVAVVIVAPAPLPEAVKLIAVADDVFVDVSVRSLACEFMAGAYMVLHNLEVDPTLYVNEVEGINEQA